MHINIRPATEQDLEAVYALLIEFAAFQGSSDKVYTTVEQLKRDKDLFQCLVAEADDKRIIGFASHFFTYYSWSGKALYIDDLYVTQSCRKQGVGKALLDAIVQKAKDNGCFKVRWQTSNWNHNAIAFYKTYGAEIDEVEINCDLVLK
jgi:GNAT superfamily N-acetyltransferase